MKKIPWIAGAALAATLAAAAIAQAPPEGPPSSRAELQARIADHFNQADSDHDGFVTRAEFDAARTAMRAKFAERRGERRDAMFAKLDTDGNGSLSKAEFLATPPHDGNPGGPGGWHRGGGHGPAMMRRGMGKGPDAWFTDADADKDGKVSLAEASAAPLAMFDRVDADHDGTISPAEREAARDTMRAKWKQRRGGQ